MCIEYYTRDLRPGELLHALFLSRQRQGSYVYIYVYV